MIRVRTVFTGVAGSPWYNNVFFDDDGTNAQAAVDTIGGFWADADGAMRNTVTWATEPTVSIIDPATGSPTGTVTTTQATGAGGSSADMVPVAAQALVRMNTGVFLGGREVRGAIFVPGLDIGVDDGNGVLLSTFQAQLLGWAQAMITTPGNLTPAVWSRKNGSVHDVATFTVTNKWAVLRSRRD